MGQAARGLRLVFEARVQVQVLVFLEQFGADGLERHRALDVHIVGLVHDAHGAFAQHAIDAVLAELL